MRVYKIIINPCSPFITPLQADTLFGHLCWVVAHRDGEKGIKEFLEPFMKGSPPFVLSDGFPAGLLPKPLSLDYEGQRTLSPEECKRLKKVDFVDPEKFKKIQAGKIIIPAEKKEDVEVRRNMVHNTINRLTFTTMEEGGLYTLEERFVEAYDVYVKVISEDWKEHVVGLLEELSHTGFGKKKSIGKGHFTIEGVEPADALFELEGAGGFVTLSSFFPRREDPVEGFYRTFVKYGKLGEEFTYCGNPFKRPVMLIKTGSVFKTDGRPAEYYGCMIKGVAPAKPEVVQYGYAFTVPLKWRYEYALHE